MKGSGSRGVPAAVDAAASGATGLLLLLGAGSLATLLGLPAGLLRYAGLILVPFVVFSGGYCHEG